MLEDTSIHGFCSMTWDFKLKIGTCRKTGSNFFINQCSGKYLTIRRWTSTPPIHKMLPGQSPVQPRKRDHSTSEYDYIKNSCKFCASPFGHATRHEPQNNKQRRSINRRLAMRCLFSWTNTKMIASWPFRFWESSIIRNLLPSSSVRVRPKPRSSLQWLHCLFIKKL